MTGWRVRGVAAILSCLVWAGSAAAQSPLSLEIRGGRAVPIDDFRLAPGSTDDLSAGHAFGVNFQYEQGLGVSAVVGFSQYRVTCEGSSCGGGEQWVSTQWELGARWRPFDTGLSPWFGAAVIVPRVERDVEGEMRISDTSYGVEGGAGIRIRITPRWSIEPGVRWARFDASFREGPPVAITFLTGDVGLRVTF